MVQSPIVYVTDASQALSEEAAGKYFSAETLQHIASLKARERNAFLWSRLILRSADRQFSPDKPSALSYVENYSNYLALEGSCFRHCSVDFQDKWVAVALSAMPINVAVEPLNWTAAQIEQAKLFYKQHFVNWIERQNDPVLAFYQLYTANKCLTKRRNPTIRIVISDDDTLTVRGAQVSIREGLQYRSTADWICAVQGPVLGTLLSEVRTAEKTFSLLAGW